MKTKTTAQRLFGLYCEILGKNKDPDHKNEETRAVFCRNFPRNVSHSHKPRPINLQNFRYVKQSQPNAQSQLPNPDRTKPGSLV